MSQTKAPSLLDSLTPIVALLLMLATSVYLFSSDSSSGANQIALIMAACIALLVAVKNGYKWKELEAGIVKSVASVTGALLILFAVGALIGTWILAGTVPAMIYYGIQLLSPDYFYAASCLICAVIAISIGSSWTVAGTIGVALIGIASALGLNIEMTAGAIISGAYFGDKMSPLSDTTNLAPAVVGTDIFKHIKHMSWTTVPSILIALTGFLILGFNNNATNSDTQLNDILVILDNDFSIGLHLLLPLVVVLFLAYKKTPAFPTVILGSLSGALCALIFQFEGIVKFANDESLLPIVAALKGIWITMFSGYEANTSDAVINQLLSRGGMSGMLNTIWLILCAMAFGGVMEVSGMLKRIVQSLLTLVKGSSSLIITTLATCIGANIITADQYIAIVLPGRMYKLEFERRGFAPTALSRVLEDSATITSPLIPWNTCGVAQSGILGVATLAYAPYCIFNWVSPIMSLVVAGIGYKLKYKDDPEG